MNASPAVPPDPTPACVHAAFVSILPRIERHGAVVFRALRCRHRRDELMAETVALAWLWFVRLVRQGTDPTRFASALATYAARAAKAGRRLCGIERAKDVLSGRAQHRRGFGVVSLPQASRLACTPLDEALHDNMRSPVPDQVAFRHDFPAWLGSRSERDRRVIGDLMLGERSLEVAARYGLSPARVSQLRREFRDDWRRFCGEPDARA